MDTSDAVGDGGPIISIPANGRPLNPCYYMCTIKLSRYYPVRLFQDWPDFGRLACKAWRERGQFNLIDETPVGDVPADCVTVDQIGRFVALRREASLRWERWADFWSGPRQIFDFSGSLVTEFSQTDVDDAPVSGLTVPFPTFYLHFGENTQSVVSGHFDKDDPQKLVTCHLDGVFVMAHYYDDAGRNLGELELAFTTRDDAGLPSMQFGMSFIVSFEVTPVTTPTEPPKVHDAIRVGMEEALLEDLNASDREVRTRAIEIARERGIAVGAVGPITYYSDTAKAVQGLLAEGTRLLVNALFYLATFPKQRMRKTDSAAPKHIADAADNPRASNHARKAAESMLRREGFGMVTLVNAPDSKDGSGPTRVGGSIGTHWRRGHWRHQRHGKGLLEIKLTWIRPALVNAVTGEAPNGPRLPDPISTAIGCD